MAGKGCENPTVCLIPNFGKSLTTCAIFNRVRNCLHDAADAAGREWEMKSPTGVEIVIGQLWREVDSRFERIVRVANTDSVSEKVQIECTSVGSNFGRGSGARWAKLSRFNGKRGGYALTTN